MSWIALASKEMLRFPDCPHLRRAFERSAEADDHQQEDGISDHHLVRRIAAYDFVSVQTPLLDDEDSALEESLRAGATTSGEESANRRFNLTVCAFIPHEKVSLAFARACYPGSDSASVIAALPRRVAAVSPFARRRAFRLVRHGTPWRLWRGRD